MTDARRPLNEEMLPGNTCFGCSLTNSEGLRIRVYRDGERDDRLVGEYQPRKTQEGFPKIVHGGAQFTALDCMAGWLVFGLRAADRLMPLTQGATIQYRRPVALESALRLTAEIVTSRPLSGEGKAHELWKIHAELQDEAGRALTVARLDYVVVPEAVFRDMVGLDKLPEIYRRHFSR